MHLQEVHLPESNIIPTLCFTTVEGPLEVRGDMLLDLSVRLSVRLLLLDRRVFRNQIWYTVSLCGGATFRQLFPKKWPTVWPFGHFLFVPFDVCRGILVDSIVAKKFDGIGWLMQLLLGSILAGTCEEI